MNTEHRIITGDARQMTKLADKSIQLIITSPPYWQLKDYGKQTQIGFDHTYEDYINNLNLVWNECFRVLDNDCKMCINIGDQYARSVYYGWYKVIPIRTEIIKFCEAIGFDYMGAIIWQKVTTSNTTGGASIMGSFPYPRNGILKLDYEFILIFKKFSKNRKKIDREIKLKSKMTREEWKKYFSGHWHFTGVRQDKHLAMFPEELPKRLIKMFSFVNETILDPFLGSGTTTLAAKNVQRNSVGYEINPEFVPIIKSKIGYNENNLFDGTEYFFEKQKLYKPDFKQEISELPYIFKDKIKLEQKVDPKKLQFGSKIDKNSKERNEYYSVKKILSANKLQLNTNLVVKLIGIKIINSQRERAIAFLENKFKNQKIFLKFDKIKYDDNNNLLCYVYLKNKTFINAHLIKNGLATVDTSYDYKNLERFKKMEI